MPSVPFRLQRCMRVYVRIRVQGDTFIVHLLFCRSISVIKKKKKLENLKNYTLAKTSDFFTWIDFQVLYFRRLVLIFT